MMKFPDREGDCHNVGTPVYDKDVLRPRGGRTGKGKDGEHHLPARRQGQAAEDGTTNRSPFPFSLCLIVVVLFPALRQFQIRPMAWECNF